MSDALQFNKAEKNNNRKVSSCYQAVLLHSDVILLTKSTELEIFSVKDKTDKTYLKSVNAISHVKPVQSLNHIKDAQII